MIKTGGVNVAPLEVEQVLLQHPDVVQAYVVGVPDQAKGEIVAGCGRAACRRSNRYRFDHRVLPRAVGKLQSSDPARLSNGGTAPAHADGQNP
jgi:AMP-binding enzyme C-terminal domain